MKFQHFCGPATLLLILAGCGQKDYYIKTETGPHGQFTSKKVYYTPEQKAEINQSMGYGGPSDPKLVELEDIWPKLTDQQRASLIETAKQMAPPK